jgi:hypothetical protein
MARYEKRSVMGLWFVLRNGRQEGPVTLEEDEVESYMDRAVEDDEIRMRVSASGMAYGRVLVAPGYE